MSKLLLASAALAFLALNTQAEWIHKSGSSSTNGDMKFDWKWAGEDDKAANIKAIGEALDQATKFLKHVDSLGLLEEDQWGGEVYGEANGGSGRPTDWKVGGKITFDEEEVEQKFKLGKALKKAANVVVKAHEIGLLEEEMDTEQKFKIGKVLKKTANVLTKAKELGLFDEEEWNGEIYGEAGPQNGQSNWKVGGKVTFDEEEEDEQELQASSGGSGRGGSSSGGSGRGGSSSGGSGRGGSSGNSGGRGGSSSSSGRGGSSSSSGKGGSSSSSGKGSNSSTSGGKSSSSSSTSTNGKSISVGGKGSVSGSIGSGGWSLGGSYTGSRGNTVSAGLSGGFKGSPSVSAGYSTAGGFSVGISHSKGAGLSGSVGYSNNGLSVGASVSRSGFSVGGHFSRSFEEELDEFLIPISDTNIITKPKIVTGRPIFYDDATVELIQHHHNPVESKTRVLHQLKQKFQQPIKF